MLDRAPDLLVETLGRLQRGERAERGVDVVKVMGGGGATTPGTDIMRCQFTPEELRLVVEEAHAAGLPVTVHGHALAAVGLSARHPDEVLLSLWRADPDPVAAAVARAQARAAAAGGALSTALLLKRASLPRLAKALR